MKKGIFLLSVLILISAAWSAGWYYVVGKVETVIADTKINLADRGRDVRCANQHIDGYPFRISLNCDEVRYADDATGLVFEAGKLKSAAQAYQPNKAIVELSSPANLRLPNGEAFKTDWNSMRSSLKVGLSGAENLSIHGKEINLVPTNRAEHTMQIKDMQLHGRQIGEDNINLALNLIEAKSANEIWPSFNLNSTFLLEDIYKDVMNRTSILRVAKSKGLKGTIERFQYTPNEGGMLAVTGPAEVNRNGLLTGKFDVTLRDLPQLLNALSKSFPEQEKKFTDASRAIALLSQKTGKEEITIPITVRNGSMSIGIIPLGKLPPLF